MALPPGWIAAGAAPSDYEMALDATQPHSGRQCAVIRCIKDTPRGFGTLMQMFIPDDYRGKRVRLSAWIRSEDVLASCGLWMRVDGRGAQLAFDNMQARRIRGTTAWTEYQIVLNVAKRATNLAFGILLDGRGAAWLDDVTFEIVGYDVPTTGDAPEHHPRNLSFED